MRPSRGTRLLVAGSRQPSALPGDARPGQGGGRCAKGAGEAGPGGRPADQAMTASMTDISDGVGRMRVILNPALVRISSNSRWVRSLPS